MCISIEQAKALDAIGETGSLTKASEILKKRHSALVYLIKNLEEETGLEILDRSKYRTTLTPVGKRLWDECKKLLSAQADFECLCRDLASGWEPRLRVSAGSLVPLDWVMRAVAVLAAKGASTQVQICSEFVCDTDQALSEGSVDVLISAFPPERSSCTSYDLEPVAASLVVHRSHLLAMRAHTSEEMKKFVYISTDQLDTRLNLNTSVFSGASALLLGNRQSIKSAVANGNGFAWIPDHLIQNELKSGEFRLVQWDRPNRHFFHPKLYMPATSTGKAAKILVDELRRDTYFQNGRVSV
ncbi:MAG: LysR family transcriptional regulator [Bdellovibrionota bacterium]